MKTYIQLLDILIVCLLILAIQFNLSDNYITDSVIGRRGVIHTRIICWQSLFAFSSFCLFLRYVAQRFSMEME
ncbi:MAG: hypothetical protein ABI687_10875 [Flavitalea sp.]